MQIAWHESLKFGQLTLGKIIKGRGRDGEGKGRDPTPSCPPNPYFWICPWPLKKGVVLPLAIVKKGVELPLEHIKKG